jgi:hypothetical protein
MGGTTIAADATVCLKGVRDMRVSARAIVLMLVLLGMGAVDVFASDPPYLGTWKLNPAKSDFGESTVTYEQMADGQVKFTADGQSFTFRIDGKDYPTPWGNSSAWKSLDANTWEVTNKTNAKVVGTATVKLAADGKTLSVDAKNIKATGEASHDVGVYQRLSGGPGLAGQWKTKNLKIGSPGTITITPNGSDGVTLTFVEEKGTCSAKFDGKDYAATGPIWPSGWTCAIAKIGATGLEVSWKREGQVMSKDTLTPAADGKTLVDVSGAPKSTEKVTVVYDRQ